MKKNHVPDPNSMAQGFDFVHMPSDGPDDPDPMLCASKLDSLVNTTLVPETPGR
jgi:hypothetical protein